MRFYRDIRCASSRTYALPHVNAGHRSARRPRTLPAVSSVLLRCGCAASHGLACGPQVVGRLRRAGPGKHSGRDDHYYDIDLGVYVEQGSGRPAPPGAEESSSAFLPHMPLAIASSGNRAVARVHNMCHAACAAAGTRSNTYGAVTAVSCCNWHQQPATVCHSKIQGCAPSRHLQVANPPTRQTEQGRDSCTIVPAGSAVNQKRCAQSPQLKLACNCLPAL